MSATTAVTSACHIGPGGPLEYFKSVRCRLPRGDRDGGGRLQGISSEEAG